MINCYHCNSENGDDAKFCKKCGKPVVKTCSECDRKVDEDANFCEHCGAPQL